MPTTRETVLAALQSRLQSLAALVLRDEVLPERIPAAGLIILRDGQPGEPEVTLSPLRYHYQRHIFGGRSSSVSAGLPATLVAMTTPFVAKTPDGWRAYRLAPRTAACPARVR
ncbi:hypothetical protein RNZ50_06615 [Paracoccaceae bacterium Fryx2]|nr:hypothetical protein [Paracoccaceae bacterium Fryx2]